MTINNETSLWFAVQVRARNEMSTGNQLRDKGYEGFVPTQKERRRWADRYKIVESPLFPGYVFCQFDYSKRLPILMTPGVMSIVGSGGGPSPVSDQEIAALKQLVASGLPCEPWPYLQVGQRVRITAGPLKGLDGLVIDMHKSCRLILSVTLLQRSVSVEVDRYWIEPYLGTQAPNGIERRV